MLASSLAGLIWFQFGVVITFIVAAAATIFVILYFVFFVKNNIYFEQEA